MSHPGTLELEAPPVGERSARWTWTAVIVGLLCVQLAMSGVAIFLATGDPSAAVVPNYHKHALEWDQYVAVKQQSAALGWQWDVTVEPKGDVYGNHQVTLELHDRDGRPLDGATLDLHVWHHARAAEPVQIALSAVKDRPGIYAGTAVLRRSGLWHLDLLVRHGGQSFLGEGEQTWRLQ